MFSVSTMLRPAAAARCGLRALSTSASAAYDIKTVGVVGMVGGSAAALQLPSATAADPRNMRGWLARSGGLRACVVSQLRATCCHPLVLVH